MAKLEAPPNLVRFKTLLCACKRWEYQHMPLVIYKVTDNLSFLLDLAPDAPDILEQISEFLE